MYGGPGHGSDFPYKVGHPDWPRGPVHAVLVHSNPLFHTLCSTSLSRPPFLFPLLPCSLSPPTPLLSVLRGRAHTPIHTPIRPSNAPRLTAASPQAANQTFTGTPPPPAFTWTFNGNTPSPGPLPGPLTGTSPFLPSSSFSFFLFSFPPAPVVAHPACQAGLGVPSRAPGPAQRVHPTPQDQWCSTGTRGRPTEEPQCTPIAPRALTRALNRSFLAGPGPWSLTGASCSSSSSSSLPSFTSIQVYFICCCFVVPPLPLSSPVLFFPSLPWGGYIYFTLCRFLILVRAAQCD